MKKAAVRFPALVLALLFLLPIGVFSVRAQVPENLEEELVDSLNTGKELDVSQYQLTAEQLQHIYCELYLAGKFPWFADHKFNCEVTDRDETAVNFIPQVLDPVQYNRNFYERSAAEILAETVHDGMEPWEKALSVHDYLIAHSAYDKTQKNFQGYDLLVNGTAVCSGYAAAYMDLMNRIGIPCVTVESKIMGQGTGHSWNLVCLDGKWYHVDLTWDDPIPNVQGRVSHRYFLLTDEQMLSEAEDGHFGWDTDIVCDSTDFQNGFWKNVPTQIIFPDADHCFYRDNQDWTLCVKSRSGDSTEILHTEMPEYIDIGNGDRAYEHSGFSLWNNRLYFSSSSTVYSMAPDGTDLKEEYTHDIPGTGTYISGSYVDKDQILISFADCVFNVTSKEIPIKPTGYHKHKYTPEVVSPTCVDGGCTRYTCECGISYRGDPVPPAGHQYQSGVVKRPTFSEEGIKEYVCSVCGDTYEEIIPVLTVKTLIRSYPQVIAAAAAVLIILILPIFFIVKKRHK